jgi:type VI secretion system protein ImpA
MAPIASSVGAASPVGELSTRQDVVQQLERICEYYDRHEPSSPIPLLLRRAKRLVSQNFLTIIRDLTPSGLMEAEAIGGVDTAKE